MAGQQRRHVHLTHWGAAEIESDGRTLTSVRPWREDPAPSRILENLAAAHRHPARVDQPYIRKGWLEHGPGAAVRGSDVFVPVSWTMALDLLAGELRRVYGSYGPDGVFGGILRLGQRGPVPPCPEPAAPVPELPGRIRPVGE